MSKFIKITGFWERRNGDKVSGVLRQEDVVKLLDLVQQGKPIKVLVCPNKYKDPGSNQPDYNLLAFEVDPDYNKPRQTPPMEDEPF